MSDSSFSHVSNVFSTAVNLNHIFHPFTDVSPDDEPPSLANRLGAVALLVLSLVTLGTLTGFYFYRAHKKIVHLEKAGEKEQIISSLYQQRGPQSQKEEKVEDIREEKQIDGEHTKIKENASLNRKTKGITRSQESPVAPLSEHQESVIKALMALKGGNTRKAIDQVNNAGKETLTSEEKRALLKSAVAKNQVPVVFDLLQALSGAEAIITNDILAHTEGTTKLKALFQEDFPWEDVQSHTLFEALYDIIPNDCLNSLNYDALDRDQIALLFPFNSHEEESKKEKIRQKLACLSEENFKKVVGKFYSDACFSLIPDCHLNHLNYASDQLTDNQLQILFPLGDSPHSPERLHTKARLAKLDENHFAAATSRFQNKTYFSLVTDENSLEGCSLNDLDYNALTSAQMALVFPLGFFPRDEETKETKKKLEKLNEKNFKIVVNKFNNDTYFNYIPKNHLNHLNYAALTVEQIETLFSHESTYGGFDPISDEIISYHNGYSKKKLTLLTEDHFKIVIDKLSRPSFLSDTHFSCFRYIPDNHLNHLDYNALTPGQITQIFPLDNKDTRLALLTEENFKIVASKLQ